MSILLVRLALRSSFPFAAAESIISFCPELRKAFHKAVLAEILKERGVSSRGRQIPRGVKRKMSNFPLRHRHVSATGPIDYSKQLKVLK